MKEMMEIFLVSMGFLQSKLFLLHKHVSKKEGSSSPMSLALLLDYDNDLFDLLYNPLLLT